MKYAVLATLEDVGHNADLYIANQEDNTQQRLDAWSAEKLWSTLKL